MNLTKLRVFFAIEIPEKQITQISGLIRNSFAPLNSSISWIKSSNLHITLKFLDELDQQHLTSLIKAISGNLTEFSSLSLKINGLGLFPESGKPRVLWIGIDKNPTLKSLTEMIEQQAHFLGYAKEHRRFSPHLTIGRVKHVLSKSDEIELLKSVKNNLYVNFGQFEVNKLILFKSTLLPTGAVYSPLAIFNLGKS